MADDPTDNGEPSEVGYRRPPKHAQFKKGQSGNPRGRPKNAKGFKQDRDAMLRQPVPLANGTTITTQKAMLATLRAKALKGDGRSLDRLMALAAQAQEDEDANRSKVDQSALSEADNALIADFIARRAPSKDGES